MYRPSTRHLVPSRSALRVLRRLALAGSTASVIGSVCTVATITYEVNRRVRLAEHLVEQKRTLESSCPNYSTSGRGLAVERMMEAAEAGEFLGLDSIKKSPSVEHRARSPSTARIDTLPNESRENTTPSAIWTPGNKPEIPSIASTNNPPPKSRRHSSLDLSARYSHPRGMMKFGGSSLNISPSDQYQNWKSRIENHLKQGQPIEAAHHFLRPPGDFAEGNMEALKELSTRIFNENLKAGNTSLAGGIFRWDERNGQVTSNSWEALLLAQGSRWSADTLASLYLRHADRFELSYQLRSLVLRSLVDSYRLGEAKQFIFRYLKDDNSCGLSAIYLGGLYTKSRNMELVETQAGKLASTLLELGIAPTERLFNPLLKAYIESGYDEKAEALIKEMKDIYGITIGLRPLGLLAYGKALKSDWPAVEEYLQQIHELELDRSSRKNFTKIFDRIFLEYFLGNSGESIRAFIFRAIEAYGLEMDDVLFEHILIAFIQKGSMEMVDEFLQIAKAKSWNVTSNKEHFIHLLRNHRMTCEKSTVGLWRMFRSSQQKHGRAGASQRILGFDRDSFPLEEVYKLPWTGERTIWSDKVNSASTSGRDVDKFVALRKRMIHSINSGRMDEALELFTVAKASGKVMKQIHIELAIVASLMRNGSANEAQRILEEAKRLFPEFDKTKLGTFYKQIFEVRSKEKALKMAVFLFYRTLEDNMLPIKHHMTVSASAMLIKHGKPGAALRLFRAVNKGKYGATVPFDAVAVKMISRAAAASGSRRGLRWAILTAMSRSSALHRDLVVELQRLVAHLKYLLEQHSENSTPNAADDALYDELEYLEYLVKLLDQKEAAQSGRVDTINMVPTDELSTRDQPVLSYDTHVHRHGSALRASGLAQTLANWCERSEFETASGKERKGPIEMDGFVGSRGPKKMPEPELQLSHG
ncbi:pentatricopeptide repeat protein [Nannizzia gypsea CBS 118893]|uniref:Pentatricopeptide repeat protein n=1 Tax=Arthroderma gypseum (strain ATCC MYA-4604 / CBS 118893) TaxID=535722 RepID=E4V2X7_ARTGP|nr:pentatricopeptide repeat protein [Nannizzia gypsea CBS 118893]EFR04351.1 pentatricopeptide repeat protein [Nannizzia gypsea CBS 118893]